MNYFIIILILVFLYLIYKNYSQKNIIQENFTTTPSLYSKLTEFFERNMPISYYVADNQNNGKLMNLITKKYDAEITGPFSSNSLITRSSTSIPYYNGTIENSITYPINSLPITYTMIAITKYNGPNKGIILTDSSGNNIYGHNNGKIGVIKINNIETTCNNNKSVLVDTNIPIVTTIRTTNMANLNNLLNNMSDLDKLFGSKQPWGIYAAESYSNNILYEIRGNGRNAICNNVTLTEGSGYGAETSIPYIYGTKTSTVEWPIGSIPSNFTICSITRYTRNQEGYNNRILNGSDINLAHGHYAGRTGWCYYNNNNPEWGLMPIDTAKNQIKWIVTCGKNNNNEPNNILINGVPKGNSTNGGFTSSTSKSQLLINKGFMIRNDGEGESSDWAFSHLIIWDQHLSDEEMVLVSNLFMNYLKDGKTLLNKIVCYNNTNNIYFNGNTCNNIVNSVVSNNNQTLSVNPYSMLIGKSDFSFSLVCIFNSFLSDLHIAYISNIFNDALQNPLILNNIEDIIKEIIITKSSNFVASNVTASNFVTSNVAASNVDASNIVASNINASNFITSNVAASNVDASNINASNINASNINASNINASNNTASNVAASNIITSNVAASNNAASNITASNNAASNNAASNNAASNKNTSNNTASNNAASNNAASNKNTSNVAASNKNTSNVAASNNVASNNAASNNASNNAVSNINTTNINATKLTEVTETKSSNDKKLFNYYIVFGFILLFLLVAGFFIMKNSKNKLNKSE